MPRLPAEPDFLLTGVCYSREGMYFRTLRVQGRIKRAVDEVQVMHLDEVAVRAVRGSRFFLLGQHGTKGNRRTFFPLLLRRGGVEGWTLEATNSSGSAAFEALPNFELLDDPFPPKLPSTPRLIYDGDSEEKTSVHRHRRDS